ncbi:histone-fold-containing protein [Ephemerocybe angulata]|uniref:Histone-fold-containing protein n=1 Tax=Ephemerocybe angulata TaxID=980116 RepID=A0A8H6IHA6_9AGAR|nr:histone-fold-containing protein [Tulosesus angulatus]
MPMKSPVRRPRGYIPPSPAWLTPSRRHYSWESSSIEDRVRKPKPVHASRKYSAKRKSGLTTRVSYAKVLEEIHPTLTLSRDSTSALDDFLEIVFHRIAATASELASTSAKTTISANEIQTAVRVLFPATLAEHAISEGTKAVIAVRAND